MANSWEISRAGLRFNPEIPLVPLKPTTVNYGLWGVFRITIVCTRLLAQQKACPLPRDHFLQMAAEFTQARNHDV